MGTIEKNCGHCLVHLEIDVNWTETRRKNHVNLCDVCYKKRQRRYQQERQNDPKKLRKQREYRIKREYGISMDEFEIRMATSDCCEICGWVHPGTVTKNKTKRGRSLVYDHCHKTMTFRGVLCDSCNTALGKLGDNIEGVTKAINYLKKTEKIKK